MVDLKMYAIVNTDTGQVLEIRSEMYSGLPEPLDWDVVPPELEGLSVNRLIYDDVLGIVAGPLPPEPTAWPVLKSTIRQRLRAVYLEEAADTVRASLPQSDQVEWAECLYVASDDARMIAMLTAIGANPGQILARDSAAIRIFGMAV